ncbi:MAG: hypothetical protein ACQPRJ_03985 [Solitalea-like symbiont of Acarus siro]
MAKYNATFRYRLSEKATQNDNGFWDVSGSIEWMPGGHCYIEKYIPAKEVKGVDGTLTLYTYEIFLPKEFKVKLYIGTNLLLNIGGNIEKVTITGVDNTGKKHIILWALTL